MDHYQHLAKAHFTVRRIERIRAAYEELRREVEKGP
jgi:hypothetical protein